VLWRRSKLGLHYSAAQREAVARWWHQHFPQEHAALGEATQEPAWS
jgi:hypothetical protein